LDKGQLLGRLVLMVKVIRLAGFNVYHLISCEKKHPY
jgi:hypothetical protein